MYLAALELHSATPNRDTGHCEHTAFLPDRYALKLLRRSSGGHPCPWAMPVQLSSAQNSWDFGPKSAFLEVEVILLANERIRAYQEKRPLQVCGA